MPTLSAVMTACGSNGTTCSRMSMVGRILSTNGMTNTGPLPRVFRYRPRRCTLTTRACGTSRIDLNPTIRTKSTMTPTRISRNVEVKSCRLSFESSGLRGRPRAPGPRARVQRVRSVRRPSAHQPGCRREMHTPDQTIAPSRILPDRCGSVRPCAVTSRDTTARRPEICDARVEGALARLSMPSMRFTGGTNADDTAGRSARKDYGLEDRRRGKRDRSGENRGDGTHAMQGSNVTTSQSRAITADDER